MSYNGTTVPTGRDNTYTPDEIHRKDNDELFETAFNKDQKKSLDNEYGGSELPEVTSDDDGKVLTVVNGSWAKATIDDGTDAEY